MPCSRAARRFALAAALLLTPLGAAAEADGPDFYRVTGVAEGETLALHEGADEGSPIVGVVVHDADGLRNHGCKGGLDFEAWTAASEAERKAAEADRWCEVEIENLRGWAPGAHLAEGAGPGDADDAAADDDGAADEPAVWEAASLDGATPARPVQLLFAPEGGVSGSTGCNRFSGSAEMAKDRLQLSGPLAVTRMACAGESAAEQERRILELLQGGPQLVYDPFADRIELIDGEGGLTLERGAPAP